MLKSLLTTTALVALLAGGSAVAQTQSGSEGAAPQPNPSVEGEATMNKDSATEGGAGMEQTGDTSEPATTDPSSAMTDESDTTDTTDTTAGSSTDTDTDTDVSTDTEATTDTQTSAMTTGDVGGFVTQQEQSEVLATTYIGKDVLNAQDEKVGKINDLVMDQEGRVTAAVIGVGGFLGIGEKNVGVPIDSIEVRPLEGTDVQLVMQSTREELEAAPEFADLDEQDRTQEAAREEQELEQQRQQMDTPSTTGTTN